MFEHAIDDDAAPFWKARIHPEMQFPNRRLRRCGPRSKLAQLRRSVPKHFRTLPGMSLGESRDGMPGSSRIHKPLAVHDACIKNGIYIYNINIQQRHNMLKKKGVYYVLKMNNMDMSSSHMYTEYAH